MKFEIAELADGRKIRFLPNDKIGEGTEKEFFQSEDEGLLVGFFKESMGENDPERVKRLELIIDKLNPCKDSSENGVWEKHFCWPEAIIIKPRLGIIIRKFPSSYFFSDGKGEKKARWFLNNRLIDKLSNEEKGDFLNRLKICIHLSRSLGRLHNAGLAHSDLSGNNVLVDPEKGECMLIDIDALVVKGVFPPKVLGTRGFIAPEVLKTSFLPLHHPDKKLPNISTDLHALAVFIYQLLLLRHPLEGKKIHSEDPEMDDHLMFGEKALFIENRKDNSNLPENLSVRFTDLGDYLEPLIERAFVSGLVEPELRPTAYEWEDALKRTVDILYPCRGKDCWHKWLPCRKARTAECPFCGWIPTESVPLLHIFRKIETGHYSYENSYITIWHLKKIYECHFNRDKRLSKGCYKEPDAFGIFSCNGGTWFMVNKQREYMVCSFWERVPSGQTMPISHGKIITLQGTSKERIGCFEMLTAEM